MFSTASPNSKLGLRCTNQNLVHSLLSKHWSKTTALIHYQTKLLQPNCSSRDSKHSQLYIWKSRGILKTEIGQTNSQPNSQVATAAIVHKRSVTTNICKDVQPMLHIAQATTYAKIHATVRKPFRLTISIGNVHLTPLQTKGFKDQCLTSPNWCCWTNSTQLTTSKPNDLIL